MPLVRLAKVEDYESFDLLGRTMYRVTWCELMCPGNPTDDPISGLAQFNDWQCARAAGHETVTDPSTRLNLIVEWCLAERSETSKTLTAEILKKYKQPEYLITLDFEADAFQEPGLAYRYELAFLNAQVQKLPASTALQLQTSLQVV